MKKTGNSYLIDTNIIIDFFGKDDGLKVKLSNEQVIISSVVIGEMYFGAYASSKEEIRLQEIKEFIGNYEIVHIDENTAQYYGQIKSQLKKSGTPIPENDVWIAALAMQHNMIVATRDLHFDKIKSIQVARW